MSFLGGVCGLGDGGCVVLLLVVDVSVVDHELHGVLVDGPGGGVGECLVGHLGQHFSIPSGESVAFLGGVCGLGDGGVVLHLGFGLHAIDVEGQLVLVDLEDGGVGDVCGRHLGSDLGCPSLEGMSFLGGICGLGDGGCVVLLLVVDVSVVDHELHLVLVDGPGGGVGDGAGGYVGRYCRIPSGKGIAFLGGILRFGDGGVVLQLGFGLHAIDVERHLIFIYGVLGGDGDVLCGHGLWQVVPSAEGVAGLGSRRWSRDGLAESDVLVL